MVVLKKLSRLRIETWSYKVDPSVRHIGPMAQDFASLFGVGESRRIALSDAVGVAYAATQGLYQMLKANDARLATLRREAKELHQAIRLLRPRKRPSGS